MIHWDVGFEMRDGADTSQAATHPTVVDNRLAIERETGEGGATTP
jgi:hypothetical protein